MSPKKGSTPKANQNAQQNAERQRRATQAARDRALAKLETKRTAALQRKVGDRVVNEALSATPESCRVELLKMMLDPETYGPGHWPDSFGSKVAVAKFVNNVNLVFSDDLNFWAQVNPTLANVFRQQVRNPSGVQFYQGSLYPLDDKTSHHGGQILSPNANTFTTIKRSSWAGQAASPNYMLQVDSSHVFPPKATLSGLTVSGLTAVVNDASTITWRAIDNLGAIHVPAAGVITLPNATEWFKLQVSSTKPNTILMDFGAVLQATLASGVSVSFFSANVPDYDDLTGDSDNAQPIVDSYRVVAQSVLVTFEGDLLYTGGNIAGKRMMGGEAAQSLGLLDYASIASLTDSFEGPIKDGLYYFWRPSQTQDMEFREPEDTNIDGELPSLVFAGKVSQASTAVRVRIITCIEYRTRKSYIPVSHSRVSPHEIDCVNETLAYFPQIMENPLHLDAIRRKLGQAVKAGTEWYKRGRQFLTDNPALATALASAGRSLIAL